MANEGGLLSAQEVAKQLRIADRTVLNLIQRGKFPNAFQVGRVWRIPQADLKAYVEKQRRERRAVTSTSGS